KLKSYKNEKKYFIIRDTVPLYQYEYACAKQPVALKPDAENVPKIQVTNLWCNRLIGDAHLTQDSENSRFTTISAR
ncbi:MAG: hypothetical protein LBF88_11940, partial [Planctomycetaceae bacterium]|nr:hypothetical protein [Planctomycetaceae bacterium]